MREVIEIEKGDESYTLEIEDSDMVVIPEFFHESGWKKDQRIYNSTKFN